MEYKKLNLLESYDLMCERMPHDVDLSTVVFAILWAGERVGRSLDKASEALEQISARG